MTTRSLFASLVVAAAVSGSAVAADLPVRVNAPAPMFAAPALWTGFYIGGHLGYAQHDGGLTAFTPWNGFAGFPVGGLTKGGLAGGMQAGYNYQMGAIVLGLEGDVSALNAKGWSNQSAPGSWFSSGVNWSATLAPRIGFTFGQALVYAKGGVAFADFTYAHLQNSNYISASTSRTGWVLGAGLEYALTRNLSMKAEYNYMDFGKGRTTINSQFGATIAVAPSRVVQAVKLGVNYRFGGDPGAVMAKY